MDKKTKARFKNDIIEYLLEWGKPITTESICLNTLGKHYDYKDATNLCDEIISYDPELLNVINNYDSILYGATEKGKSFLEDGGFIEVLRKEERSNRWLKYLKEYFPIGISLTALVWTIFKPIPEPQTKDKELKQIQQRMDYIEGTLHKEVDSLKTELLEASMLIATYETDTVNR